MGMLRNGGLIAAPKKSTHTGVVEKILDCYDARLMCTAIKRRLAGTNQQSV